MTSRRTTKATPRTRSKPATTHQEHPPPAPTTEAILTAARRQAADLLAQAGTDANHLLTRAADETAASIATAGQWAEEVEQLRAAAEAQAEHLTVTAAARADQILTAARTKADQLLTEARAAVESEREQATAEAGAQADHLVEAATVRAGVLLAEAEDAAAQVRAKAGWEAEALVTEAEMKAREGAEATEQAAEARARQLLAEAERSAQAATARAAEELADLKQQLERATRYLATVRNRTDEAREEADQLVADRRRQADRIHREAITASETALSEAAQAAEAIRTTATETVRQMVAEAEKLAAQIRHDAQETGERLTEAARTEADGIREDAADEARRVREQADTEALELRQEAARDTAALRDQAMEAIQQLHDEAKAAIAEEHHKAATARGKAESESERLLNKARREAERILADADGRVEEADQQVRLAQAAVQKLRDEQERREAAEAARRQGKTRKAWRWCQEQVPAGLRTTVLVAGIAYTAQREHQLAVMSGVNDTLAWLIAVCVDAWVLASARSKVHKEMAIALGVMAACQVAAILADFHLLGTKMNAHGEWRVHWMVAVPLALVVPVVIWRVHALMDHAKGGHGDAHGERTTSPASDGPLTQAPGGAHDDPAPRPAVSAPTELSAQPMLLPAQATHGERSHARAISAGERGGSAHPERSGEPGAAGSAHGVAVMSDAALMLARQAAVRPLYDALRRRPTAGEIYTALINARLLTGTEEQTRSTCQRVRTAIEEKEPHLHPAVGAGRSQ